MKTSKEKRICKPYMKGIARHHDLESSLDFRKWSKDVLIEVGGFRGHPVGVT